MWSTPQRHSHRLCWLILAAATIGSTGCQSLNLPSLSALTMTDSEPNYLGAEPGYELDPATSADIYRKVREARAQNSIVLQVIGDDDPARVLPLPPEDKSVFVSNLLSQTGVSQKMGGMDVILFRDAPGTIGGIRMEVKMSKDHRTVRPESDYALRPGDRLRVDKAKTPTLRQIVEMAFGV